MTNGRHTLKHILQQQSMSPSHPSPQVTAGLDVKDKLSHVLRV